MKRQIQRILNTVPFWRSVILSLRNRQKVGKNRCSISNIHCSNNRILMSGSNNELACAGDAFLRDCRVSMDGDNNRFAINDQSAMYGEGIQNVFVCGHDNLIIIGKNCNLRKVSFFIRGNGNRIVVGENCSAYAVQFHIEQDENVISIGSGTTLHGRDEHSIHMAADEGSKILIGEDCMISNGVQIRSTDSHSVVDMDGARLNPARDVVIGDHCWLGLQVVILKGTILKPQSIVGAGAICSKRYEKTNCILAVNPARIVRENVDWDRKFV